MTTPWQREDGNYSQQTGVCVGQAPMQGVSVVMSTCGRSVPQASGSSPWAACVRGEPAPGQCRQTDRKEASCSSGLWIGKKVPLGNRWWPCHAKETTQLLLHSLPPSPPPLSVLQSSLQTKTPDQACLVYCSQFILHLWLRKLHTIVSFFLVCENTLWSVELVTADNENTAKVIARKAQFLMFG